MKTIKIILTLFSVFFTFFVFGQEEETKKVAYPTALKNVNKKLYSIPVDSDYLINYEKILLNETSKYFSNTKNNSIAIQPSLLNENITKIFNTVVLSNSDLASNGSAIGYQKNDDKQTVSVNAVATLKNNWFLKVGVNAKGASAPYNFYSANTWSSSVGGNVGFIYKWKASTFYTSDNATKTNIERLKYVDSLVKVKIEINKKLEEISNKIKVLEINKKESTTYYHKRDSLMQIQEKLTVFKNIFQDAVYNRDLSKDFLFTEIESNDSLTVNQDYNLTKAIEYVQKELYEFDKKNDITYGYSLHWFDIDFSLNNSTYQFEKENINSTLYDSQNEALGFDKKQVKLQYGSQLSYNYTRKGKHLAGYFKGSLGFQTGSFLSSNLITGTPKIDENQNIYDETNIDFAAIKGNFSAIDRNLSYGNISAYGAMFFGKSQKFGANINLKHHYLISKPNEVFYKMNFSALIGPIFKATGAEGKGVIVGVDFGYDNVLYKTKINDNFTARLRVGIPFSIFTKEEKASK